MTLSKTNDTYSAVYSSITKELRNEWGGINVRLKYALGNLEG